jgi:hypothetical protein
MNRAIHPRVVQICDEPPIPSFFIRFREPIEALGFDYASARAEMILQAHVLRSGQTGFERSPLLSQADVVLFQRAYSDSALDLFRSLRAVGKPLIYETDDFMPDLPVWSGLSLSARQRAGVVEMTRDADLVTCSTQALCDALSEFSSNVRVIANYALPIPWKDVIDRLAGPPHLAIVNTDYFKLIRQKTGLFNAIEAAISRLGYNITFIGTIEPEMHRLQATYPSQVRLETTFVAWHRHFLQRLSGFGVNVGVVPLEYDPAHRFKSDIKVLDFASLGAPCLVNNTAVYSKIVSGENGFVCDGSEEGWYRGLAFLADREARLRCGHRAHADAQARVLTDYASEFQAAILSVYRPPHGVNDGSATIEERPGPRLDPARSRGVNPP